MEDELKEIAMKMNEFSNKYGFAIYVECYEYISVSDNRKGYSYNPRIIKPEIKILGGTDENTGNRPTEI